LCSRSQATSTISKAADPDPILVKLMESGPVAFLLARPAGIGKTRWPLAQARL
jgi:hypothetical protein